MTVLVSTVVQSEETEAGANLPRGHFVHPGDPSGRTALCGVSILGIPAFGRYVVCPVCIHCHEHEIGAVKSDRGVVLWQDDALTTS